TGHLVPQEGIECHQLIRGEDLRLVGEAVSAEALRLRAELGRFRDERTERGRTLCVVPAMGLVRVLARVEDPDVAGGTPGDAASPCRRRSLTARATARAR